ncbi:MAG: hypothetical protein Greene101447_389 [Parcubacteria group bacterium Greene1014_47]|nr:MAG: hypothetical protein Greene101447_389 [Parcubacteria group bacterium Greene1014_47]
MGSDEGIFCYDKVKLAGPRFSAFFVVDREKQHQKKVPWECFNLGCPGGASELFKHNRMNSQDPQYLST